MIVFIRYVKMMLVSCLPERSRRVRSREPAMRSNLLCRTPPQKDNRYYQG